MPKRTNTAADQYGQTGYPAVERLIDTEDFEGINAAFEQAYVELDEIARTKRSIKKQKDARKAMKALELTMDLFRELLAIKYRLQEEAQNRQKAKH